MGYLVSGSASELVNGSVSEFFSESDANQLHVSPLHQNVLLKGQLYLE